MSDYQMAVSNVVQELLDAIVYEMGVLFGIQRAEAVARINEQWHGRDLSSDEEIILHEDEYYWALFIYFGGKVSDWKRDADRSDWTPRPKPDRASGYWTVAD
jgi:hypothetical protein